MEKQSKRRVVKCRYQGYFGNIVINQIDLIIKQPQIISLQEKRLAESYANYRRRFSVWLLQALIISHGADPYSSVPDTCQWPCPQALCDQDFK